MNKNFEEIELEDMPSFLNEIASEMEDETKRIKLAQCSIAMYMLLRAVDLVDNIESVEKTGRIGGR